MALFNLLMMLTQVLSMTSLINDIVLSFFNNFVPTFVYLVVSTPLNNFVPTPLKNCVPTLPNNIVQTHVNDFFPTIADSLRSLEQGITVFKLGNETFSIEKENLDLKENGKLKYSRFTLC